MKTIKLYQYGELLFDSKETIKHHIAVKTNRWFAPNEFEQECQKITTFEIEYKPDYQLCSDVMDLTEQINIICRYTKDKTKLNELIGRLQILINRMKTDVEDE